MLTIRQSKIFRRNIYKMKKRKKKLNTTDLFLLSVKSTSHVTRTCRMKRFYLHSYILFFKKNDCGTKITITEYFQNLLH